MPEFNSSRVKTTGKGEIEYVETEVEAGGPLQPSSEKESTVDPRIGDGQVDTVSGLNIGVGHGVFAGSNGSENVVLEFKSIQAGDDSIIIEDDGTTLKIFSTANGTTNPGGGSGGPADGFELNLGNVAVKGDGSWTPGAVALDNTTKVSEAVDRLNEVLGKLTPSAPPEFPNGTLTVANQAGSLPRLASGFDDHTGGGHGLVAGAAVTRIVDSSGVTTNVLGDVGPGESGTINLLVNGSVTGTKTLTGTGDAGTFSGLVISDQKDYPVSTPGFWKSIDVGVTSATALVGLNKVQIEHSGAGDTNELVFVRDDLQAAPVVTGVTVTQNTAGTLAYSSGIPHYGNGAKLNVSAAASNLAGQTYYGGPDVLTVSGAGPQSIMVAQAFDHAAVGVTTPIAKNTLLATTFTPVVVDVNANTHGFGWVRADVKNVNGAGTASETGGSAPTTSYSPFNVTNTKILVKRGAAGARIDEMSVPVTNLGSLPNTLNAVRVGMGNGDMPAGAEAVWDQTALPATHEAVVVAGVLLHDRTNYASGFLPAGPNLSTGRDGAQYATFTFQRAAVSAFKINITGTYAGCWVKLPGVSDNSGISPNATNGWWDATKAYDGAGVPGEAGDPTAGCAQGAVMTGASGTYTITFGPQSSTNATGNRIIVRIRLNAGQVITALSFSN